MNLFRISRFEFRISEAGAAPLLVLVAVIGLVGFLAISSAASFKGNLFSSLFPKKESQAATNNPWVSAYYLGYYWDWMSDPTTAVNAVDMSTMTHLIFARYSPGSGVFGGNSGDLIPSGGTSHQTVEDPLITKAHANNVKALMMVGGAGDGQSFDNSTVNSAIRATFIKNILDKAVAKNYDGVDIDWEENLGTSAQQSQVVAFMTELRAAAGQRSRYQSPNQPFVITFPVFYSNINFPQIPAWNVSVAAQVDQLNIMSYAMSGAYGGWDSWHFSPLYGASPTTPTSVEQSVQAYVNAGVPRSKMGIGIGLYGISYNPPVTGPKQSIANMSGWVGANDNENYYAQLVRGGLFNQPNGTYHWDDVAKQSYYSFSPPWQRYASAPTNLISFFSYEDEKSIEAKAQWVKSGNAGGTIVWAINYGDLSPTNNPMMQAVKQTFLGSGLVPTPVPTPTVPPTPTPVPQPSVPPGTGSTITFDSSTVASTSGGGSLNWAHTINNAGSNRILIVSLYGHNNRLEAPVTNVTYKGIALNKLDTLQNIGFTEIWYLIDPPTGTNTVSVSYNNPQDQFMTGLASSWTGVDLSMPFGTINKIADTEIGARTRVLSGTAASDLILTAFGSSGGQTLTYSGNTTGINKVENTGQIIDLSKTTGSPNSTTVNYSVSNAFPVAIISMPLHSFITTASPSPLSTVAPSPNPLPGDINGSKRVDILDYNLLITDYGASAGLGLRSDINHDNIVNILDYNLLITNYNKSIP